MEGRDEHIADLEAQLARVTAERDRYRERLGYIADLARELYEPDDRATATR